MATKDETQSITWIDASKEKPDDEMVVLVYMLGCGDPIWLGFYSHEAAMWYLPEWDRINYPVTHWAELPEGP